MSLDPVTYDIPFTKTRWDRVVFALELRLFSPGSSDMARLRGYLRVKRWRNQRGMRARLRAAKSAIKLPARAAREAWHAVTLHGGWATRHYGVSRARQLMDLWWVNVRHGIYHPAVYYGFRLYEPGRRRLAPAFFQDYEVDQLFRMLSIRAAREEAELLVDKARFERWLIEHELPTTRTLLELAEGTVVRSSLPQGRLPQRDLFSKPNDAFQGIGTQQWTFDGGGWRGADDRLTEEELIAELLERSRTRGVVVQERLVNHSSLASLAPAALSTVRILTLRRLDGSIQVVLATCKIPTGDAQSDHMAVGGVAAAVDLETGILGQGVRKNDEAFVIPCVRHPDSGVIIEGFRLPHWEKVTQLAVAAHATLPKLFCVGWDIAILESGPIIIEGNDNPGHASSQLPTGIPLGETEVAPTLRAQLARSFGGD